eukprot:2651922-Rhodomonas_salina.3
MPAPVIVMLIEPVDAEFARMRTLWLLASADQLEVAVPTRHPLVIDMRRVPRMPAAERQRNPESELQIVASQLVWRAAMFAV